jgi:hypothetical protein
MTRKLSVTAACNAANQCVGKPMKFNQTSWQVFFREPGETATRSMQANSYAKALTKATEAKADIALDMLAKSHGYSNDYVTWTMWETNRVNGAKWQTAVRKAHELVITQ